MIAVRPLAPHDRAALESLLAEIHAHTHGTPRDADSFSRVAREVQEDGHCEALIAWDGTAPVGLAIYTFLHPTEGEGPAMYLKELFVSAHRQGEGAGRALMAEVARTARARGCARLDWSTGRHNAGAIRFYESLGVREDRNRVSFRVEGAALERFLDDAT